LTAIFHGSIGAYREDREETRAADLLAALGLALA